MSVSLHKLILLRSVTLVSVCVWHEPSFALLVVMLGVFDLKLSLKTIDVTLSAADSSERGLNLIEIVFVMK